MLLVGKRNQTCFAPFLQSVALPADVDGGGVMQQAIEDGCGDDRISEDRAPLAIALVRSQDDRASFVACTDELEEDSGPEIIQWQIAHLIDDEDLGSKIDTHAPIKPCFAIGAAEISDQIMRGHEVSAVAGLDGGLGQGHGKMRLPDSRRTEQDDVGSLMNEAQRTQLADLPFVDRGLEAEVELFERLHIGQMG